MTDEEAIQKLEAQIECNKLWVSGVHDCSTEKCESCKLTYTKGNMREQRECFEIAVKAIKMKEALKEIKDDLEQYKSCDYLYAWTGFDIALKLIDKHTGGLVKND